jgi:hypothetical protein
MNPYREPTFVKVWVPVNRQWLQDMLGPFWLVLALSTMGLFCIVEWLVYDAIDYCRASSLVLKGKSK